MYLWKVLLTSIVLVPLFEETELCLAVHDRLRNRPTQGAVCTKSVSGQGRLAAPMIGLRGNGNIMTSAIVPAYYSQAVMKQYRGQLRSRRNDAPIFFGNTNNHGPTFIPGNFQVPTGGQRPPNRQTRPTENTPFSMHQSTVGSEVPPPIHPPHGGIVFPSGQGQSPFLPGGNSPNNAPTDQEPDLENKNDNTDSTTEKNSTISSRKTFRTLSTPSCATDDNLPCERDGEYDTDVINKVADLLVQSRLDSLLSNEVVSHLINDTAVVRQKDMFIRTSFSEDNFPNTLIEETAACTASESIIYPQRAKTQARDWVFVVNQDMVRQGVRVEKCIREGSPCNLGAELPPTVKTVCRQKFIYRKLLVLSSEGTDIQTESVLIPSCCVCYFRSTNDIFQTSKTLIRSQPPTNFVEN